MGAVAVLLVVAMCLILAQTMGPASAQPKAGHGHRGGTGAQPPVELTGQITRQSGSYGHSSRGDKSSGSRNEPSGNDKFGDRSDGKGPCWGDGCARPHQSVETDRSGGERADIVSPITLPANTVPTTTVPRTTPTTRPPRSTTTVATTVPPTTPPTVPPTVPPTGASGTPSPPAAAASTATSTSPALGGAVPIRGVAVLQVAAQASAPSTTAVAKGAKGKNTSPGTSAPSPKDVSGEAMVGASGAWKGLSLRAATNLKVPILFGIVVALFVLGQALIDRRDPKMSRAPERNDEDTVGFQ